MRIPGIRIMRENPLERNKPKEKIYCAGCGIRLGGWRNRAIEYKEGHYCNDCHWIKQREALEEEKNKGNVSLNE